jgi:hypothetical protein
MMTATHTKQPGLHSPGSLQHGHAHPLLMYSPLSTGLASIWTDSAVLMNSPTDCPEYIAASSAADLVSDIYLTMVHPCGYILW